MQTIRLSPKPPYEYEFMVRRLRKHNREMYRFYNEAPVRAIRVHGKALLIELHNAGTVDSPAIDVHVHGDADEKTMAVVSWRLARMFSADVDLAPFYAFLRGDPVLQVLAERMYGLHLWQQADLFECMVRTIIGQQLNVAFAQTLAERLMALSEEKCTLGDTVIPVFPSAEQVAELQVEQLRELQYSTRKAEYVIEFAKQVAGGALDLESLRNMDNDRVMERLVRLKGIGRWTVECFLLFGLGRQDLLPAADIGLRNALKKLYGLDTQPTEEQVRTMASNWSPWSSYVTYYLWESLD